MCNWQICKHVVVKDAKTTVLDLRWQMKEGHTSVEATSPGVLFFIFSYLNWLICIYLFIKQKKYCEVESVFHRLLLASCNEAVKLLSGVFSPHVSIWLWNFLRACFSICACLKAIYLASFVIWSDWRFDFTACPEGGIFYLLMPQPKCELFTRMQSYF